jgi:hypothetical protein
MVFKGLNNVRVMYSVSKVVTEKCMNAFVCLFDTVILVLRYEQDKIYVCV